MEEDTPSLPNTQDPIPNPIPADQTMQLNPPAFGDPTIPSASHTIVPQNVNSDVRMQGDELDQICAELGIEEDTEIPEASESGISSNKAFLEDPPEDETNSKKTKPSEKTPEKQNPNKSKKNKSKKTK